MSRYKIKHKPVNEINVVPYIDVMLVLMVIFMITAPLMTQGVKIDLPQAAANPVDKEDLDPLVVSVNVKGELFVDIGENTLSPVTDEILMDRIQKVLKQKPATPVMIKGDRNVKYGQVLHAMVLIQQAGAPNVGLISESPDS